MMFVHFIYKLVQVTTSHERTSPEYIDVLYSRVADLGRRTATSYYCHSKLTARLITSVGHYSGGHRESIE